MTRVLLIGLVLGVLVLAVGGWTYRASRWAVAPARRRRLKLPRPRLAPAPRPAFA